MIRTMFTSRLYTAAAMFTLALFPGQPSNTWAAETGEQDFTTNCGICHTIGGGKLIGPDLAGVHDRRPQQWLELFVKSSQTVINGSDAVAVALYEEYNKMLMPDPPFTDQQIADVLGYIKAAGAKLGAAGNAGTAQAAAPEPEPTVATAEDIRLGQDLFQGTMRFENGGPACNSCHEVINDAVIGGGVLALELTTVFTKLGGTGVRAILDNTPFPVMEAAYKNRALTDKENFALVAFLQDADAQHVYHHPRDYGTGLLLSGVTGSFFLFGFYSLLWIKRRRDSVNQKIYDRQVKSTWE